MSIIRNFFSPNGIAIPLTLSTVAYLQFQYTKVALTIAFQSRSYLLKSEDVLRLAIMFNRQFRKIFRCGAIAYYTYLVILLNNSYSFSQRYSRHSFHRRIMYCTLSLTVLATLGLMTCYSFSRDILNDRPEWNDNPQTPFKNPTIYDDCVYSFYVVSTLSFLNLLFNIMALTLPHTSRPAIPPGP